MGNIRHSLGRQMVEQLDRIWGDSMDNLLFSVGRHLRRAGTALVFTAAVSWVFLKGLAVLRVRAVEEGAVVVVGTSSA